MKRFMWGPNEQPSVEQHIDLPKDEPESALTAVPVQLPNGYELIKLKQPDGAVVAVRRKLALWQDRQTSMTPESRPASSGSSKTILSRGLDGTLHLVERPARESLFPSAPSRCLSQSSSVYSVRPDRDTMTSTITDVDAALADLRFGHQRRHSRRNGSATTTASRVTASGTFGDTRIGHIEELDEGEEDYSSTCSDDGEAPDGGPEQQSAEDPARSRDRYCMNSSLSLS